MCAVCTIHEQQLSVGAAQVGQRGDVAANAVIGRRGEQHGLDLGVREQLLLGSLDRELTGNRIRLDERRGHEIRRDAEQRTAVAHGFVYLTVEQHRAAAPNGRAQHGKDALCRAAGEEKAVLRGEKAGSGHLGLADRAFAGVQVARAVGFGEIDGENIRVGVENGHALVAGHMEPRGITDFEQL